jgi:hypothetical protein
MSATLQCSALIRNDQVWFHDGMKSLPTGGLSPSEIHFHNQFVEKSDQLDRACGSDME